MIKPGYLLAETFLDGGHYDGNRGGIPFVPAWTGRLITESVEQTSVLLRVRCGGKLWNF
jgi:hypothetical protein